ncbi:MAG TPA: RNA polymerase sigma factor [Polyangiaceae bacterium]|nr:RNA polymerase sigma factor [Polyangiaceae bacterium]
MSASPRPLPGDGPRRDPRLADPGVLSSLSAFVRARVPPGEADDIVQGVLAEALAAERPPVEEDQIRAWLHGIARHKIIDSFRQARRERPQDPHLSDAVAAPEAAHGARELMRWAERELPAGDDNARTFEWMLREGAGEKLASIAADAEVPAPRVRQRVSRLRKHYRSRWAAEVAALALLVGIAVVIVLALTRERERIAPLRTPPPVPSAGPSPSPLVPPPPPPALPAASVPDAGRRAAPPTPTASIAPTAVAPRAIGPGKATSSLGGSEPTSAGAPSATAPIQ